jgi:hypothetical protein
MLRMTGRLMYDLQMNSGKLDTGTIKLRYFSWIMEDAVVVQALFEFGVNGHDLLTLAWAVTHLTLPQYRRSRCK